MLHKDYWWSVLEPWAGQIRLKVDALRLWRDRILTTVMRTQHLLVIGASGAILVQLKSNFRLYV
ncbi:MAG: hypothetical protein F4Y02_10255 [Chloroflexi bacterium]|nr:hypothetical protein [Chloroflexota bacterium]